MFALFHVWYISNAEEKAVSKDKLLLTRVRRTHLSLRYSDLEILRTETDKDLKQGVHKLDLFEQRAKEFDITMLKWGPTPR